MPERVYGIRHHGPGSARAVVQELDKHPPGVLLVEGPPEADDLVRWAAAPGLEPPVALLGYAVDDPGRAAFWPFAVFSPEWQAIRWAVEHNVPVRFFDLPFAFRLTDDKPPVMPESPSGAAGPPPPPPTPRPTARRAARRTPGPAVERPEPVLPETPGVRRVTAKSRTSQTASRRRPAPMLGPARPGPKPGPPRSGPKLGPLRSGLRLGPPARLSRGGRSTRSVSWPRRPATTIPSGGGRTWSSIGACRRSRRSPRR